MGNYLSAAELEDAIILLRHLNNEQDGAAIRFDINIVDSNGDSPGAITYQPGIGYVLSTTIDTSLGGRVRMQH